MVSLSTVLLVTLVAHSLCAAGVVAHGRLSGRETGSWPLITLIFGVGGIAGYLLLRD